MAACASIRKKIIQLLEKKPSTSQGSVSVQVKGQRYEVTIYLQTLGENYLWFPA